MSRAAATRLARWRMAAVALAAGLLAAGCGSGGLYGGGGGSSGSASAAASSPATSPTSALCQDAAALHASLNKLTHVSVGPGAGDEIKTDLSDVKEKLNALRAQSHGELQAQTSALKTTLLNLQGAASTLSSHPSASSLSEVVAALSDFTSTAGTMMAALRTQCPSLPAYPRT